MSNCAVCGKPVKSGIVVHSECWPAPTLDNKPLTIEEMHAVMDSDACGMHIWVKDFECKDLFPAIVDRVNLKIVAVIGVDAVLFYKEKDYGKTWLAYCNKPSDEQALEQPKTNADLIRAMSDKELAKVIVCQYPEGRNGGCYGLQCKDCCLDWLKQPAEVE